MCMSSSVVGFLVSSSVNVTLALIYMYTCNILCKDYQSQDPLQKCLKHSLVPRLPVIPYCKRRKAGGGLGTRLLKTDNAYFHIVMSIYNTIELRIKYNVWYYWLITLSDL